MDAPRTAPAPLTPAAADGARRPTVLAVDDTPANLNLLTQLLGQDYRVQIAVSGAKALELARRRPPDIIVLDIMMPAMDGYEVCRQLKADPATRDVPVIFLTALSSAEDETRGFEVGGADFVAKPFTPATLRARVHAQLELKAWRDALHDRNRWLQDELDARLQEVDLLRETTLLVMVSLAEFRDEDTGNHIKRTQEYVRELVQWLQARGHMPPALGPAQIDAMIKAAPLHDIGKIAIPDAVLLKPGPLGAEEWEVMKAHTRHGADLLQRAVDRLGERAGPLLQYGMEIARHHHEKWDGSGYPDGLAGEAIPLSARLMAVADVYDALISRRPYKDAMGHADALAWIEQGAGRHFDPLLVRALQDVQPQLIAIAEQWHD
ncbi:MAG: two-component system response regulator [Rubrivivax sp.]|nr:two-component system response regulator [Rubrivivax sp.]